MTGLLFAGLGVALIIWWLARPRRTATVRAPVTVSHQIPLRGVLGPESRIVVASRSDPGRVHQQNEDSIRVIRSPDENGRLLALVCDGMGGHAAGEQASRLAADVIVSEYRRDGDPGRALHHAVDRANRAVYQAAQSDPRWTGMGTTCTALVLQGGLAWCAHVGDSRCYLIRNGELFAMTEDHSAVMALVRDGVMSRDEARTHPDRNVISRALGSHRTVEIATWAQPFAVHPGDRFLLASDGLHDAVTEPDILHHAAQAPPYQACAALIAAAHAAGAPDNVSVIMLAIPTEAADMAITRPVAIAS